MLLLDSTYVVLLMQLSCFLLETGFVFYNVTIIIIEITFFIPTFHIASAKKETSNSSGKNPLKVKSSALNVLKNPE